MQAVAKLYSIYMQVGTVPELYSRKEADLLSIHIHVQVTKLYSTLHMRTGSQFMQKGSRAIGISYTYVGL